MIVSSAFHKVVAMLMAVSWMFLLTIVPPALAQHEGHNMPGMSKSKAATQVKKKPVRRKGKPTKKKTRSVLSKQKTVTTPEHVPGHQMPTPPAPANAPPTDDPHANMPGMKHPAAPSLATPAASPDPHRHNPEMEMPQASPKPTTMPANSPHTHANMPMPAATPGAQPDPTKPDAMKPDAMKPATMDHSIHGNKVSAKGTMNMGPLLVMSGESMGLRIGPSDRNVSWMGQMGSGTSWLPASTPMYMWHKQQGDWLLMLHGEAKIGVNSQGGPRGVTRFESANWLMPMAFHRLGKGTLQLRGMFSFEPFTFPPGGSPLLFQTGETYKGQPLIDRQHPHDLFMELSAQYTQAVGEHGSWFAYFGYPGEPSLGPPAFMHRASASENPSATLAHHLQDSTHISFGVFTGGFTYRWFKLEGSIFNGQEPDENRYNFEAHPWSSRSARLSFAPNQNWAMQVSYGFLRRPEAAEPDTDIRRTTASVHYNKSFARGNWASSLIWGRNHATGGGEVHNTNGYTFESTVNFQDKNYLYTRLELVDKNELLRAVDRALLGIADDHPSFRIGSYTFGGARDLWNGEKLSVAIGSDLTFYSKPAVLDAIYGSHPVSWKVFLRLRPLKMKMSTMHGTH